MFRSLHSLSHCHGVCVVRVCVFRTLLWCMCCIYTRACALCSVCVSMCVCAFTCMRIVVQFSNSSILSVIAMVCVCVCVCVCVLQPMLWCVCCMCACIFSVLSVSVSVSLCLRLRLHMHACSRAVLGPLYFYNCCSVLQYVAVCCRFCSVLRCVAL